jgi:superfamily I DNA and/or RNA helicase
VAKLNTLALLKTLAGQTREREQALVTACDAAVERRSSCAQQVGEAAQQTAEYLERCHTEQAWWETLHAAIPAPLIQDMAQADSIHRVDYVRAVLQRARTAAWQEELTRQTSLVQRTEPLVRDWIKRLKENQARDAEALRELYVANANVLGVTCGQVPRLTRRRSALSFDVVIVDEVSKATLPELLLPMSIGHKIILVGDHKQLPPMVQDNSLQEVAAELKLPPQELVHFKQALFGNLYNSAPQVLRHMLTEQYRMRPAIMHAINQFYDHLLTGGHQRPHHLPVMGLDHDTALAWVTTPNTANYYEVQDGSSFANPQEVDLIEKLLDQMNTAWQPHAAAGEPPKEVGVITFYMAQFNRFRKRTWHTRFNALHIRIGTVDRFQGMERDVIVVSLVRNNPNHNIGFAKEPERINVAFSRARELLVIVGCQPLFAQSARHAYEATAAYAEIAKIAEHEGKVIRV